MQSLWKTRKRRMSTAMKRVAVAVAVAPASCLYLYCVVCWVWMRCWGECAQGERANKQAERSFFFFLPWLLQPPPLSPDQASSNNPQRPRAFPLLQSFLHNTNNTQHHHFTSSFAKPAPSWASVDIAAGTKWVQLAQATEQNGRTQTKKPDTAKRANGRLGVDWRKLHDQYV